MNLYQRYRRLTFWNKIALWGGISSIVALPLALILWIFPFNSNQSLKQDNHQPFVLRDADKEPLRKNLIINEKNEQKVSQDFLERKSLVIELTNISHEIDNHLNDGQICDRLNQIKDEAAVMWHLNNNINTNIVLLDKLIVNNAIYSKYDQAGVDFLIYARKNLDTMSRYINFKDVSLKLRLINLKAYVTTLNYVKRDIISSIRLINNEINIETANKEKSNLQYSLLSELNLIGKGSFVPNRFSEK